MVDIKRLEFEVAEYKREKEAKAQQKEENIVIDEDPAASVGPSNEPTLDDLLDAEMDVLDV